MFQGVALLSNYKLLGTGGCFLANQGCNAAVTLQRDLLALLHELRNRAFVWTSAACSGAAA